MIWSLHVSELPEKMGSGSGCNSLKNQQKAAAATPLRYKGLNSPGFVASMGLFVSVRPTLHRHIPCQLKSNGNFL